MAAQPFRSHLIIASAIVIAGVLISSSLFVAIGEATKTVTRTTTETVTSTSTLATTTSTATITMTPSSSITSTPTVIVNGSLYYADDVSTDITVGNPGYSYFHNGSVIFLGVQFTGFCPPSISGCPVQSDTAIVTHTTMSLGAIALNITFPDKTNETIGGVIGDIEYFYVFSHHANPQAGILITYTTNGYQGNYKAYLLISKVTIGRTTIISQGTSFQVQSSYDCVAGHVAQAFNVSTHSLLQGTIIAGQPGVTFYVSTAQDAESVTMGHPAGWVYSSGLTNSTNLSLALAPGSYVLWTEGADLGCGSTIVTPLEQLTTVTVTQAVTLTPTTG